METKESQVSQALISDRFPLPAQAPTFAAAATRAFVCQPIPQSPLSTPRHCLLLARYSRRLKSLVSYFGAKISSFKSTAELAVSFMRLQ